MQRQLLALCAALPFAAAAGTIEVEYWGTVSEAYEGSMRVGQAVTGTMRIDTALAPRDLHPSATEGNYIWNLPCDIDCPARVPAPSAFVEDGQQRWAGTDSDDHVYVVDGRTDQWGVENTEWDGGANRTYRSLALQLAGLVTGEALAQSFDVAPRRGEGYLTVDEALGGVKQFWVALLERVRVTPVSGACRAT